MAVADRRENLRAADVDRQFVAERLKAAVDEGRLSLGEYDDRLKETYAARTYGDLDVILSDLPGFRPVDSAAVAPASGYAAAPTSPAPALGARGQFGRQPHWLLGIWSGWLIAVTVNVVIWALVSISNGEAVYFWPMWVAGPLGAVLLATSVSTYLAGGPDAARELKRERRRQRRER
ncbi:DUF1707 domain-containing protein [Dactylosporangium sp. NPDC049525]|uniref:DUF1707 SHOCT-like domain-containing protein n=1 Tax=Dactylosporangium sp. NPDC049525 TaxID=3154730 RepID=UPI00342F59AC